ncbi:MAG TPA: hypothetical protein VN174_03830 [Candidatus Methanoperedens sp.]|nr:hypothetical protein [Candidatus Methanoperedens sp.]
MAAKKVIWSRVVETLRDLNIEARDKTILVECLDDSIMTKAEVIGVSGIICLEDNSNDESEIPIKKVDRDEWKKLR